MILCVRGAYRHGVSFHSSIIISYCLKIVESEPKYLSKTPFSHICLIKRKLFSSNIDKKNSNSNVTLPIKPLHTILL